MYREWACAFPPYIGIYCIQLPGRGARIAEVPIRKMESLAKNLSQAIRPRIDKPVVFFGHSWGALIAFEVARQLRRLGPCPSLLIASASAAPQAARSSPSRFNLPDLELIAELRRLQGSPPQALEDEEVMQMLLPAIRADLEVGETYVYSAEEPLNCPIVAIAGSDDSHLQISDIDGWKQQTSSDFFRHVIGGNHFFLLDSVQQLATILLPYIDRYTADATGKS